VTNSPIPAKTNGVVAIKTIYIIPKIKFVDEKNNIHPLGVS